MSDHGVFRRRISQKRIHKLVEHTVVEEKRFFLFCAEASQAARDASFSFVPLVAPLSFARGNISDGRSPLLFQIAHPQRTRFRFRIDDETRRPDNRQLASGGPTHKPGNLATCPSTRLEFASKSRTGSLIFNREELRASDSLPWAVPLVHSYEL